MVYGPLYAGAVLRPFAEQLTAELGDLSGRRVYVMPGDCGVLGAEVRHRGAILVNDDPEIAVSLGTLGSTMTPSEGLAALIERVPPGAPVAALHLTEASSHEAIARAALGAVGVATPDRWLEPLPPTAIAGFTVMTVRDIVRFDSPRQFYAALITERGNDAGLDAIEQRRILARCTADLLAVTAFDDTVRLPVEALLLVRH